MFHDAVSRKIKEYCLFSFYCLTERKDKESENGAVWKFRQSEDLCWGVSASKKLGEELQQILADVPAVASHVLGKLLKNNGNMMAKQVVEQLRSWGLFWHIIQVNSGRMYAMTIV